LCRRHRWQDESIDRELGPPIHAVVVRTKILEEVFGDPCRDVACEPRRDDDAQVDPWLCCRLVERRYRAAVLFGVLASSASSDQSLTSSCAPPRSTSKCRSPLVSTRESSFSTSRWIVRRSGRAPYSGSKPSCDSRATASSANSISTCCARSRRTSRWSSSLVRRLRAQHVEIEFADEA